MRSCPTIFAAIAACLASSGVWADEAILNLGAAAPPLAVSGWVKGEKVERFEPGRTYVMEFWATWCVPCQKSIPHLTELAHRFKDKGVRFIGVNVREPDTTRVNPFVNNMGDKMDYSVALDDVPAKGEPDGGAMVKTWLIPAEEYRIPIAFVIRDGKIAWIGHPLKLDEPLARIVAGDWDPADPAKKRLAEKTKQRKVSAVRQKVLKLYRAGDYEATVAVIAEATSRNPELVEEFAEYRFAALCNGGEIERGLKLGETLLQARRDDPVFLNNISWDVIDPQLEKKPDPRVARLALQAARRAVELSKGANAGFLDTLAEAFFATGDPEQAVATEEKALKLLEAKVKDQTDPNSQVFKDNLNRYRKAASAKADRP